MRVMQRTYMLLAPALALALALSSGLAIAQDAEPQTGPAAPAALGTAFTYQGRLEDVRGPIDGSCDLRFELYTAASGGTQIHGTQTPPAVQVSHGLFTVQLDFGTGAFGGDPRWLEISVRCPAGSGSYVKLNPRQPLTPAPYALYSAQTGVHDHWGGSWGDPGIGLVLTSSNNIGLSARTTPRLALSRVSRARLSRVALVPVVCSAWCPRLRRGSSRLACEV